MKRNCTSLAAIVCIVLVAVELARGETEIPTTLVEFWADKIGDELIQFQKETTGFHKVAETFERLSSAGDLELAERNGTAIVMDFADSLKALLNSKNEALERINSAAQTLESNTSYAEDLNEFRYETIKSIPDDDDTLQLQKTFSDNVKINTSKSFIQIPTNIYKYSENVALVARWTEDLSPVFVNNFNSTPSLLWQYFGSLEGPFRTYPGKKWKVDDKGRDLYDCRRRSWFIAGSSAPKDMVIMVDISGTMIGNNVGIAKIAMMSLIDTLQENDFFNIIYYNKKTGFVLDCVPYLIQATAANKEAMKAAVETIPTPQYEDKIDGALKIAFDLLEGSGRNESTANCSKVISFFSDGVEGDYAGEDIFKERNADKKVRVFTYLIGRKKNPPTKAMLEMACNNRGYLYKIETIGNVWDTITEYLSVLSRPIALSNESSIVYTPLYLDASGLGMMMTAAIPVTKNVSDPMHARLLGVAGTDIAISTLEAQIPYWKVGVLGYGFATNNNGFLLFHPRLRKQYGYLPSPPNVVLDDVEILYQDISLFAGGGIENNSSADTVGDNLLLTMNMIDRETNSSSFDVFAIGSNDTRLSKERRHYYFMPAEGTPFSVSVVIEDNHKMYHKAKLSAVQLVFNEALESLKSGENGTGTQATVANWPYCTFMAAEQYEQPYSKVIHPTAEEIRVHLDTNGLSTSPQCNEELVSGLLLSAASITETTDTFWDKERNSRNGVTSVYAATSFGYGRYMNTIHAVNGTREPPPFSRNVVEENIYKHAAQFSNGDPTEIVFSVPVRQPDITPFDPTATIKTKTNVNIPISAPITTNGDTVLAAVVGMMLDSSYLNQKLLNATSLKDPSCNSPSCALIDCRNNETYGCYLIDESGYIVASSRGNRDVGEFIGIPQGPLVKHLKNDTERLLTNVTLTDSQFECPREEKQTSSAGRLLMPLVSMVNMMTWMFQATAIFLSQVSLPTMLYGLTAEAEEIVTPPKPEGFVSCTKALPFYFINHTRLPVSGEHDCGKSCRQHYSMSRVPKTNLILLIVDTPCLGACTTGSVLVASYKVQTPSICEQKQRYRRGLKNCKSQHKDESTACGAGKALRAGYLYIVVFLCANILTSTIFKLD